MKISQRGIDLVKRSESCWLVAYQDSKGVWTIGYGHTRGVKQGMKCTKAEADAWLLADLAEAEDAVNKLVLVPLTQNQFDALVSFTFNVGSDIDKDTIAEGLGDSTLLKKLNAHDYEGAAAEFLKWVYCGGKVLAGLVVRRKAEAQLFRTVSDRAEGKPSLRG